MKKELLKIGTSGFSYKDWLGNFYPQFCPEADFLQFYSSKFNSVEIDSTYYRIPRVEIVKRWFKVTPEGFTFTAKFPQTVTHKGDLKERLANAGNFVEVMKNLDSKLGVLLLQFPYGFTPDDKEILFELLASLPGDIRFSVELRNKKWLTEDDLFALLRQKNISFCLIDHPWMPRKNIQTADFSYIRFLGDRKKIENDFSFVRFERNEELQYWKDIVLEVISEGKECFCYFNNHYSGHAPTTATNLIQMISKQ